jgi:hypothetical protein
VLFHRCHPPRRPSLTLWADAAATLHRSSAGRSGRASPVEQTAPPEASRADTETKRGRNQEAGSNERHQTESGRNSPRAGVTPPLPPGPRNGTYRVVTPWNSTNPKCGGRLPGLVQERPGVFSPPNRPRWGDQRIPGHTAIETGIRRRPDPNPGGRTRVASYPKDGRPQPESRSRRDGVRGNTAG